MDYPILKCYAPAGLDVENLEGYNSRHHWKYLWLPHILLLKHLRTKQRFDSPVTLSRELLGKYLGDHYYLDVIKVLVQNKIIKRYNYVPGVHSYKFRLMPNVLKDGIQPIDIDKITARRKIHKYRDEHISEMLRDPIQQHEFQRMTALEIKINEALTYIDKHYKVGTAQHTSRVIAAHEFNKMKDASFADGFYMLDFMYVKDRSGRIHSPISHLPADLRQFVTDKDGNRFVEIDQACSQLTYAHKFLLEYSTNMVGPNLQYIGEEGTSEHYIPSRTLNSNLSSYVLQIDNTWRNAIFAGKAYEMLMKGIQYEKGRSEFKEKFFAELFYNPYRDELTPLEKVFKHYFPNEFKRLRHAKKQLGNKELAVQIQRMEARFWHAWVNEILHKKYRTVAYGNIHDSILVPEQHAKQIAKDISYKLERFFNGRKATIRIKDLPIKPTTWAS